MLDFWVRFNDLLKFTNFTQETLAEKVGIPKNTLYNWISKDTFPRANDAVDITKELGTTVEYLVTGENPEENELLQAFNRLNDDGKKAAIITVRGLEKGFPLPAEQVGVS